MIDHTGIGVADVARSAAFYECGLGALGLRRVMQASPRTTGLMLFGYGIELPDFLD